MYVAGHGKRKGKEGEDMSLYVTDQNYVQVKIF